MKNSSICKLNIFVYSLVIVSITVPMISEPRPSRHSISSATFAFWFCDLLFLILVLIKRYTSLNMWITYIPLYWPLMHSDTSLWRNLHPWYSKTIKGQEFHVCYRILVWAETARDILRWTANETTKNSTVSSFHLLQALNNVLWPFSYPKSTAEICICGDEGWGGIDFNCKDSRHGLVVILLGNRLSSVFVKIARKVPHSW